MSCLFLWVAARYALEYIDIFDCLLYCAVESMSGLGIKPLISGGLLMKQLLDPEAIIRSLEIALSKPFDYSAAARRLNGSIAHIPAGTLHVKKRVNYYHFEEYNSGRQSSISNSSVRVYELARRRYCGLLLQALKCFSNQLDCSQSDKKSSLSDLASFIRLLSAANLDVARIVLTPKQYEWFSRPYKQKSNNAQPALFTEGGIRVRSKSEKDIGNELEHYATPFHFEECLRVNVRDLVEKLASNLNLRPRSGSLFHYPDGSCNWNVPSRLDWMNSDGSLWRTYDSNSGFITIFPDYRIMLADGSFIFWEHEGLADYFTYRINASEREAIMKYSANVPSANLITSYERDTLDSMRIGEIIKNEILPRLFW